MNVNETNYKESRQSHAVVFVPHHLGPVKGSSPDLNPLIYLFVLVINGQKQLYTIKKKLKEKAMVVKVKYRIIERLKNYKYVSSIPPTYP